MAKASTAIRLAVPSGALARVNAKVAVFLPPTAFARALARFANTCSPPTRPRAVRCGRVGGAVYSVVHCGPRGRSRPSFSVLKTPTTLARHIETVSVVGALAVAVVTYRDS